VRPRRSGKNLNDLMIPLWVRFFNDLTGTGGGRDQHLSDVEGPGGPERNWNPGRSRGANEWGEGARRGGARPAKGRVGTGRRSLEVIIECGR
jgi:hypothetical protein